MWTLIAPSGRIVIRLAGLPTTIAPMLAEVVEKSLAHDELLPIAALGRSLRALGALTCASTAGIASCLSARHLLGTIPIYPNPQVAELMGVERSIAALISTIAGLPAGLREAPTPAPEPPVPATQPEAPISGLRGIRKTLPQLGAAPGRPATFGTP